MECEPDLEAKHRKEKKELQAQVQALKKVAKNDKTKKKELLTEIARLESELEEKHKIEIEYFGSTQSSDNISEENNTELQNEHELSRLKISKAQKRRDKKSLQDKQIAKLIKEQEEENKHGPRNTEIKAITERLKKRLLQIHLIPSDGDCLYKAIAHQLDSCRKIITTVPELRTKTGNYIENHKDDFLPFMANLDTNEMLSNTEFTDYCVKIKETNIWGGQLEIRALSNVLRCPIKVIQATGPESIDQGDEFEGPPLIVTYHRHMYRLGEHYNSTEPLKEENIE